MEAPKTVFEEDKRPAKELRVLAAVSYVPFGFVLPYLLNKGNENFITFHVTQAASLFFVSFVSSFVFGSIMWFLYLLIGGYTAYRAYTGDKFMFGFILKAKEAIENLSSDSKK